MAEISQGSGIPESFLFRPLALINGSLRMLGVLNDWAWKRKKGTRISN
jgi:hypothetical protein